LPKAALILATLLVLAGCQSPPRPVKPEPLEPIERGAQSRPIRAIAIVAARSEPRVDIGVLTVRQEGTGLENTAGGAALGAGAGLLVGTAAVMAALAACINPAAAATCPTIGSYIAAGALAGGGIGLAVSRPADARSEAELEESRAAADAAVRAAELQRFLQAAVMARSRALGSTVFSEGGAADAVLEVQILDIVMSKPGLAGESALTMTARARLVRTLSERVLYRGEYRYASETLTPARWTDGGAAKLREALQGGFDHLAQQIVEAAFAPERALTAF
jgi:hypothetical protein